MNFWEHFLRLLPRRPKPALCALYWHLTRRRVRAKNRLLAASSDLPFAYDIWVDRVERNGELAPQFLAAIDGWTWRPRFVVVLYRVRGSTEAQVNRTLRSIERQVYPFWTRIEAKVGARPDALIADAGDYFVPVRAGDRLSEMALFRLAQALQANRDALILYGDEDRINERGRRSRPWFKPRWNSELFLAQDYLSRAFAIDAALARNVCANFSPENISEFLLEATSAARGAIIHVPHVLAHVGSEAAQEEIRERVGAVARHVAPAGATCELGCFGTVKVQWPLPPRLPLVSIIVPTKDRLELLQPCVESVLRSTLYDNFELIIVDNGSVEERTAKYLETIAANPLVRVLPYPHPYNFSAINNFAVGHSRGTYVCLLNNDTEVLEPDWLGQMMRYAVRPDVGAVGAKLLYEDGSIQHAGVVVGIGEAAGHAHRFLPADQPGYFNMAHSAQFVSAVTAACLVIEKSKFEAVGGLDERELAIAFNDVDLCLKVEAAGWHNVYVPHAVLMHHESKSRGSDMAPTQVARYRRELAVLQNRWGTKTYADPVHNPNLDRYSETFALRI